MVNKLLGFIVLTICLSSCKVGHLRTGDYVRNEDDGACICQVHQLYPVRQRINVVCQIGDSLVIAKKTKFWLWLKCDPDINFKVK